jgi:hypothetical protein
MFVRKSSRVTLETIPIEFGQWKSMLSRSVRVSPQTLKREGVLWAANKLRCFNSGYTPFLDLVVAIATTMIFAVLIPSSMSCL